VQEENVRLYKEIDGLLSSWNEEKQTQFRNMDKSLFATSGSDEEWYMVV
jgi:hypothetical protein